jgi:hypothetical protein
MCPCERFEQLLVKRSDIEERIQHTKEIVEELETIAESSDHAARLHRCKACGKPWQSSRHAMFRGAEYVFRVPEIAIAAWLSEPYLQPADLVAHAETKRWHAESRQFGARPAPPVGRRFFLSAEEIPESGPRDSGGASVQADEENALGGDPQHLEPKRSAC